jgi:hypothetical protein
MILQAAKLIGAGLFTKFQRCRCKTTAAFKSTDTKAWKQLFKNPLFGNRKHLGGNRTNFRVEFQRIKNRKYENLCKKVSYLLKKLKTLPFSAVTERQIINNKISSLKETRRAVPSRV